MDATGVRDDDRALAKPSDQLRCSIYGENGHVDERQDKMIITHDSPRKHEGSSSTRSRWHRDSPGNSTPSPIARCVQRERTPWSHLDPSVD